MYREQRGMERIRRNADVRVWPYLEDDPGLLEPETQGRLIDVSKGGLCVETPRDLDKGRRVNLKMEIESVNTISTFKRPFQADAVVRWHRETKPGVFQLGLEFAGLSKENTALWTGFIGRWKTTLL